MNQPQGVGNASGVIAVNAANGAVGPPTVGDYESLLFAVKKQYRRPEWNPAFAANETSYQRARGLSVGSNDARRVFGMTHEDYRLLSRDYKINEKFTNRQQVFGCWKKYRMYRRMGTSVEVSTQGKTLMRDNLALLAVRARYGGKVIDPSAFAIITDGQM